MTLLDADIGQHPDLGEDTWELFEAIEESFGVDLGDYGLLCGKTVQELAKEIGDKAQYPTAEKCLSMASFFKLRRVLETQFGIPRADIRPATLLQEILPWKRRRTSWKEIEDELGMDLPKLSYPGWALFWSLAGPAILLVSLRKFAHVRLSVPTILIWSFALIIPTIELLEFFARDLPRDAETVGGLAKQILSSNYTAFALDGGSSENEVLTALQQLVASRVAIPAEGVSPDTRIPQDLNIY